MRHKKKGRALNRSQSHSKWLLSNLITSLFLHEKIRTTTAKAKEARPLAEKLITFAKRGDLHARRMVLRLIRDKEVVKKLFETLGIRFKDRPGGYTRITRIGNRAGDNAPLVLFELMPEEESRKGVARKRRRRVKKKEAEPAAAATGQAEAAAEQPAQEAESQDQTETAVAAESPEQASEAQAPQQEQPAGEAENKENKDQQA